MRFSAAFTRSPIAVRRPGVPVARTQAVAPGLVPPPLPRKDPSPPRDLPLDLDQRVRLVGEW